MSYQIIINLPYGYVVRRRDKFFRWHTVEHLDTVEDCIDWITSQHKKGDWVKIKIVL